MLTKLRTLPTLREGGNQELLTFCGLTSQKINQAGLGLSGSVHEEDHPCFPNFI